MRALAPSALKAPVCHISMLCDACWAHVEEFLQSKTLMKMEPSLNLDTSLAASGITYLIISSPLSLES